MQRDDFKEQIKRLMNVWGQRHFNESRLNRIWLTVQHVSYSDFEKVVDTMLDNMRYAPLPKDFQDATRNLTREVFHKPEEHKPNCSECRDIGFLQWPDGPMDFLLVSCHCPAGRHTSGTRS